MTLLKGRFSIDEGLDSIDLTFPNYTPTIQAFTFFNTMRVFFGEDFEISNPMLHYFIVDMLFGNVTNEMFPYSEEVNAGIRVNKSRIAIIAARGLAKSTVTTFFYPIYCAITGTTPVTGPLSHMLILSDSAKGGARDQAILLGNAFDKSVWAQSYFESIRHTESEVEVVRRNPPGKDLPIEKRHMLIKLKGAQALSLDSTLLTDTGRVTMRDVHIGDRIFGADGKLCIVTAKSEIFYRDMYEIILKDGRRLKVSADHINSVLVKQNNYVDGTAYKHMNLTTEELLKIPMWKEYRGYTTPLLWIENIKPLEYTTKEFAIDPYTLGLYLGDGYFHVNDGSAKLTGQSTDIDYYLTQIPYDSGYREHQTTCDCVTIKKLGAQLREYGLANCKAPDKFVPMEYMYGDVQQRVALLQGLIDTDGTVREGNKGYVFTSTSKKLVDSVIALTRSIGGTAYIQNIDAHADRNYPLYRVTIKSNIPLVRLPRKVIKVSINQRANKVAIVAINKIMTEPSQCIAVDNALHEYVTEEYIRTHNTGGIRSGSRNPVTMDRYAIIIADDVIKNEAEAYSDVIMKNVNTALSSDAINAMRAKKTQFVLINTPFHKNDPVYMSMENGVFTPLAIPICKEIRDDLTEEEFIGVWPEMHDYQSVMERYLNAKGNNNLRSFYQELMLRVTSEEDRMVQDDMIEWYNRVSIEKYLNNYNLYITTDLTSSSEGTGDYSAVYLWAVNFNQDYFLIDMSLKKQSIGDQYNEILRMVQKWCSNRYVEVGIEVDGQQRLNIYALKELMLKRNVFFTFARQKGAAYGKEGISSRAAGGSKFDRFRMVYPLLQSHKIHFPNELKLSPDMNELLNELKYVSFTGFKSKHDDGLDAISQLVMIDMMFPSEAITTAEDDDKLTSVNDHIWGSFSEKEPEFDQSTVF